MSAIAIIVIGICGGLGLALIIDMYKQVWRMMNKE